MSAAETWQPVGDGWPYEISSEGRVRSLPRVDGLGRHWPGKVLRLVDHRRGGPRCTLSDAPRRRLTLYPHRWLARKHAETS